MKHILITGVANGIGKATAQKAHSKGYKVFGLDMERPEDYIEWIQADLSKPKEVAKAIEQLGDTPLHALVNNAALVVHSSWEDFDFEQWNMALEVNLTAPVRLCHGLRHNLVAGACIINVSSQGGRHASYGNMAYSVTKAAEINLTQSLAANFGPQGVRANAVVPGWVSTESAKPFMPKGAAELSPLKRAAEPDEVADAILYLVSDEARFINGTQLVVDGGYDAIDYSMYELSRT
jgi:NAD(P)-dependent dehydrogenase (short-subunit alcohol dehydrogenase family)